MLKRKPPAEGHRDRFNTSTTNEVAHCQVDEYAKTETESLNFIRNNKVKLRADSYIHLSGAAGSQDGDADQMSQILVLLLIHRWAEIHSRANPRHHGIDRHYGRSDLRFFLRVILGRKTMVEEFT
ncbi:hypothetical protein PR048_008484 [Dryococelus australis]|uniref:Uncharacterized protein n=1 Tax=Dryococelus australis TaxID=614101 RepID=A0ABQ9HX85_9NEOP|nr:hypothetical protein PR048_008484 [Dryococelus australis]